VPLPADRLAELARRRSQHSVDDFQFLFGARRWGGRIVAERWNTGSARIGGSRTAATTCATPPSPKTASRIRKNPDIVARLRPFAYNLIKASGAENIHNISWRAALDIGLALEAPGVN
jgi:hypothetical protein